MGVFLFPLCLFLLTSVHEFTACKLSSTTKNIDGIWLMQNIKHFCNASRFEFIVSVMEFGNLILAYLSFVDIHEFSKL